MVTALLDGAPVPIGSLGTNDGLNFGRIDFPSIEVHTYALQVPAADFVSSFSKPFDALVAGVRDGDLSADDAPAIVRMGYPTAQEALNYPQELAEALQAFLACDLLEALAPFSSDCEFVLNSVDGISVDEHAITAKGRCFRRNR